MFRDIIYILYWLIFIINTSACIYRVFTIFFLKLILPGNIIKLNHRNQKKRKIAKVNKIRISYILWTLMIILSKTDNIFEIKFVLIKKIKLNLVI